MRMALVCIFQIRSLLAPHTRHRFFQLLQVRQKQVRPLSKKHWLASKFPLSELKKEYPELSQAENSPFPNTTAYFTDSPFSNISHILLVFSPENKLMLYTLYYTSQEWASSEEPFKQAITLLKLTISKNLWTIWKENEKETITVICKDFGLVSKLSPLKAGQTNNNKLKNFSLTVSDKSIGR